MLRSTSKGTGGQQSHLPTTVGEGQTQRKIEKADRFELREAHVGKPYVAAS